MKELSLSFEVLFYDLILQPYYALWRRVIRRGHGAGVTQWPRWLRDYDDDDDDDCALSHKGVSLNIASCLSMCTKPAPNSKTECCRKFKLVTLIP